MVKIVKRSKKPGHRNLATSKQKADIQQKFDQAKNGDREWVISIQRKRDQAGHLAGSWEKFCIYRVPRCLREVDDKAYIPRVVSLGPYHHGEYDLLNMDLHKWRVLDQFLKRTKQDIKPFLDAMKELEQNARACYEESIKLNSKEFVEMMVLDGCFILELFCGFGKRFEDLGYSRNDPLFSKRGTMDSILSDMIMLENQIPMFILDRLFKIGKWDQQGTVAKLAIRFLDQLMQTQEPLAESDIEILELSIGNSSTVDPLPEQAALQPCSHGHRAADEPNDPLPEQVALHCLDIFRRRLLSPLPWSHRNRAADKPNDPLPKQAAPHCLEIFRRHLRWPKSWSHGNRAADKPNDPLPKQAAPHCLEIFRRRLLRPLPWSHGNRAADKPNDPLPKQAAPHCLEIFRQRLRWPKLWFHRNRAADKQKHQLIHCVMELKNAGIKFKTIEKGRFWDIKFKNGVLKIPKLIIDDGTKSLFLNLIAFEQCHLDCTNYITSYVVFMDHLINSAEDVSYLHDRRIIEHWLGSDAEVAKMFNRLCRGVIFDSDDSYLSSVSVDINNYYDHKWNAQIALLKHKYFNSPWSACSVFAAVVLLLLTFAQTAYAIYGYYRPSS